MKRKKEQFSRQKLQQRQVTKLRVVIAGGCILALTLILLIYFNLTRIEEMKARDNSNAALQEKPVDMNVAKIKIDPAATNQRESNYKIAKQLPQDNLSN
jgi:hypothetical protein